MCNVRARRQWEEASLCADKLPMEYSESTVAPEASRGPRGRDSGRERGRGGEQCDRRWRGGEEGARARCERGCIGCLNSSKSRGSAVCVRCHALEGGAEDGGRRTERERQMRGLKGTC